MNPIYFPEQLSFEFQTDKPDSAGGSFVTLSDIADRFGQIYHEYRKRSRKNYSVSTFEVSFYNYSSLKYTLRLKGDVALIRISHFAREQNLDFFDLLAHRLWSELFGLKSPDGYRSSFEEADSRLYQLLLRKNAFPGPQKRYDSHGTIYDLRMILLRLSRQHFNHGADKLKIGWSKSAAKQRLGHYDGRAGMIILSKILDRPEVPAYVIEYIIFHEILHHLIQYESTSTGKRYHGRLFKRHEKKFPDYSLAVQWLKKDYPAHLRKQRTKKEKK